MNCLIIDDDATARLIINKMCSNFKELTIVNEFSNAIEAIKYLNKNEVDLIFLDIHMPGFSGFDFIETIKSRPNIILTTSDENFALNAFEYDNVVDYLLKPIKKERFQKAIAKVKGKNLNISKEKTQSISNENNDLFVSIDRRLVKLNIPDINIIEAKGDYIKIKTKEKNYIVHSTLKKIEDKLPASSFLKVHRSFIINISKIVDIEDNTIVIEKDVVPVSRANKSELIKRLNLL